MAVTLSAEELAAIRDATRAWTWGVTVFVAAMPSARQRWAQSLVGCAMDYAIVGNAHELAALLAGGDVRAVVIDADACPSGGLPELTVARARGPLDLPRVVIASAPTRRHVVSCVAAGATDYVAKPVEVEALFDRLARA
jgi:DNA-binding NtrC family response regulator